MEKIDLLLINPPFHQRSGSGSIFPLGLGYIISAAQKNGYICKVIDCTKIISSFFEEDLKKLKTELNKELKEYMPLLVGIGPCITTQIKALKIITDCCKDNFDIDRIFAGGPLASIDNQEWFFFEYLGLNNIIKGDGEEAIVEAICNLKSGRSITVSNKITTKENIYFNEIENIDSLAFPERVSLAENIISRRRCKEDSDKITASMITSRGCLYKCKYCVSGNMKYKNFRKRSVKSIVDEMVYLETKLYVDDIIFYDDCFFSDIKNVNKHIVDFCNELENQHAKVTWQMEIRPDILIQLRDESIQLIKKYGCRQINIGIEKTSSEGLRYIGKNNFLKGLSEAIEHIKKISNIIVAGTFILGGEDENISDIMKIIDDSKKMHLDYAHYNPLFIYPGTPIYNSYFEDERAWVDYIVSDTLPWGEIVFENQFVNRDKLLQLVDLAYKNFYADSKYKNSAMVADRFNMKKGKDNENL
ncbi:B12-binding domain-containing radical SAM protein [Kineothrix sp. MB12-C1]|uniref:B12-binding domain-containing radical SAM protein n=1 Tax=Kineothrix sp. MB12-C1 TaxID=3070215 RepID=UPI0027D306EA|nr:radical SAM protein [Kineothrix sp. MB12-C1]WMC93501.1 radical SAM protein [Kineothrix sp. MB12-C1]